MPSDDGKKVMRAEGPAPLAGSDAVDIPFQPSTIENVDYAMYEWLRDQMEVFSSTFQGWKKIPVIWVSAERSVQVKRDEGLRDDDGALILPLITLERTSLEKDLKRKGVIQAHLPEANDYKGGTAGLFTIAKKINAVKTGDFANAVASRKWGDVGTGGPNFNTRGRRTKKVVYDTYSIPTPVYVTAKYEINIRTEFQGQMNEILSPLIVYTGGVNQFILRRNGHHYEGFVEQNFALDNNVGNMGDAERQYKTRITINVLAYLMGQGPNRTQPHYARRENAVELRLPRERVIMGDIPEWLARSFFRGGQVEPTHVQAFREGSDGPPVPLMPTPRAASAAGGGASAVAVKDEGTELTTGVTSFNFAGPNVNATATGDAVTVTITGSIVGVKDEGTDLTPDVTSIDFTGAGVTATTVGSAVTVNIPAGGGGGSIPVKEEGSEITDAVSSFDFVGAGITATADGDSVTVTVNASAVSASDEGVALSSAIDSLNFTGPNVVATNVGGAITVDVSGSIIEAKDEGVSLTSNVTSIDFVGAGVTTTNTAGAITVTVTGSTNGTTINNSIVNNTTYSETPTGLINGANAVYTTSQDFIDGSELLFYNGILQRKGGTFDYTVTGGDEITFTFNPVDGDFILISYVNDTPS